MDDSVLEVPIEDHLRQPLDQGDADRLFRSFRTRQVFEQRRDARRRRPKVWVATGLALAAAAAVSLSVPYLEPSEAPALTLRAGHDLPTSLGSHEEPATYALSDGSNIVLSPHSQAQVLANDREVVQTSLDRGRVRFEVRPGGPRRWVVRAGETRVEVIGTRFTVSRGDGRAVRVEVDRGVVEVHHPSLSGPARLRAGDSIELDDLPEAISERASAAEQHPLERSIEAVVAPAPAVEERPPASRATVATGWRVRASDGDYEGAYELLGPDGFRQVASRAGGDELLLLADVARRSGRPGQAVPLLTQVMTADGRGSAAAAFTLGRVQLEQLGAPAEAARSFRYVSQNHRGHPLLEDALALEVEAWSRAGQRESAAVAAGRYRAAFPEGRHMERVDRLASGQN